MNTSYFMFLPFSIILLRYPFYMLTCIDTEWKMLTWLRYTIWMPLYPLGVLAEGEYSNVEYISYMICCMLIFISHSPNFNFE